MKIKPSLFVQLDKLIEPLIARCRRKRKDDDPFDHPFAIL